MFQRLKGFFTDQLGVISQSHAEIVDFENGNGFGLFDDNGELVRKYGRRRDAIRGAKRRGIVVS